MKVLKYGLAILSVAVAFSACQSKEQDVHSATDASTAMQQHLGQSGSVFEARQLLLSQRYEDAIVVLNAILESEPNNVAALELRGIAYTKLSRVTYALDDMIAVTHIEPNARSFFNLGNTLQQFGFCERAVDAYRSSLELQPNDYQALVNMGAAYNCYAEHNEALAVLDIAHALNPGNEILLTNLGIANMHKEDLEAAYTYLQRAVQTSPNYAPAHFALFRYYGLKNDKAMYKKHLQKFVELMPHSRKASSYKNEL